MAEPSERNREMVQSYLGDFLDYGNRRVRPTWRRQRTLRSCSLLPPARERAEREAIEECIHILAQIEQAGKADGDLHVVDACRTAVRRTRKLLDE